MALHDKDFDASAAVPLSVTQLRALIGPPASSDPRRADAVACFLAGAEGWEQAAKQLDGAFAKNPPRLTDEQSQ